MKQLSFDFTQPINKTWVANFDGIILKIISERRKSGKIMYGLFYPSESQHFFSFAEASKQAHIDFAKYNFRFHRLIQNYLNTKIQHNGKQCTR